MIKVKCQEYEYPINVYILVFGNLNHLEILTKGTIVAGVKANYSMYDNSH